jgi:hypothetical protein
LKPNRLRGVACAVEVVEVHRAGPEPDPRQVADGVHRDLGVLRARLDAEVAARPRRVEPVAGEVRQVGEGLGTAVGEAEAVAAVVVAEQARPEPERDGEAARRQAHGLPGVVGRRLGCPVGGADRAGGQPLRHPFGGEGPGPEQPDQLGTRPGGDVERREVEPVLRRRHDPGLVLATEGVRRGDTAAGSLAPPGVRIARGEAGRHPCHRGATSEQPASGDLHARHLTAAPQPSGGTGARRAR